VVWAQLATLEDIQVWSEAVVQARCEGPIAQGVGAERTCELVGNRTIQERWIAWDEGRSFEYEGFGIPMMRRVLWQVSNTSSSMDSHTTVRPQNFQERPQGVSVD
jgi:hypothetical protein